LYRCDDKTEYLYVILSGTVEEKITLNYEILQGIGSIMSCANLVNKSGKALTDCKAVSSQVKVKAIPIDQLKTFMSENKKFEEQCYKRAMMYLVNIFS